MKSQIGTIATILIGLMMLLLAQSCTPAGWSSTCPTYANAYKANARHATKAQRAQAFYRQPSSKR